MGYVIVKDFCQVNAYHDFFHEIRSVNESQLSFSEIGHNS